MREDPNVGVGKIAACLDKHYGLAVASITFLPIGHDFNAYVYEVIAQDGAAYFLKIRSGPVHEPGLLVPRALNDRGVENVPAPLLTSSSGLWCSLVGRSDYSVVLYPFMRGVNAKGTGLSDDQWREFGASLRAVHDSGLEERFRAQLRIEDFGLPSAAKVRKMQELIDQERFESPVAEEFAVFWRANAEQIRSILGRAEGLGRSLRSKPFELVLCHSDIHLANILVGEDGHIWLVDWDSPLLAPRERDLLFVVGSRIARRVEPRDEDLFFEGYGPAEIDRDALVYYRYERIIEDLGEFGQSVFLDSTIGELARRSEADLAMSFFELGGDIERAENVTRHRWPTGAR